MVSRRRPRGARRLAVRVTPAPPRTAIAASGGVGGIVGSVITGAIADALARSERADLVKAYALTDPVLAELRKAASGTEGFNYGIDYRATARLVRTRDTAVLSEASCRVPVEAFPWTQLTADNGAHLKTRLERTADLCADRLVGELLLRYVSTDPRAFSGDFGVSTQQGETVLAPP